MRELQTNEKVIGGALFRVKPLGALKGQVILFRLIKAVGPAVSRLAVAVAAKGGSLAEGAVLAAVLANLPTVAVVFFEHATPDVLAEVTTALAAETEVSMDEGEHFIGLSTVYDKHFAGKYRDLMTWLVFAIQVNFGPFESGASDAIGALLARAKGATSSISQPSASATGG